MNTFTSTLIDVGTRFGLKVLGAIAIWVIGRWVIGLVVRFLQRVLTREHVDPTLLRYLGNMVTVVLTLGLVIGILGYFGVETTSFAAVLAGAAIAIGAAWGGAYWPTLRPGLFLCCSDHSKPVTSLLQVAQRAPSEKSSFL